MDRGPIEIVYTIRSGPEDGHETVFRIVLDPRTLERRVPPDAPRPDWARIENHRCRHCGLDPQRHTHCPAALALAEVSEAFSRDVSYSRVRVTVTTRERTVTSETTLQRALQSLLGLYLATSACPTLAKFRPLARYHLPFASPEETLFRSVSAYLFAQYFLKQQGHPHEFGLDGLHRLYEEVNNINRTLAAWMRGLYLGDANINAIGLLDLYAHEMFFSLKGDLAQLAHLFSPFLESPAPISYELPTESGPARG